MRSGVAFSVLAALGNGWGAVLSRRAFAVAGAAGQNIDGPTAAYQRLMGGLIVAGVCLLAAASRRALAPVPSAQPPGASRAGQWRRAWPWVLVTGLVGQALGVSCYQWALKTTATGMVLAITSTAPLVIIPLSIIMEGEKMTRRSVCGGILAVLGVIVLVTVAAHPAK
jgi:drug/metabolite transporter (DMT)-like permease